MAMTERWLKVYERILDWEWFKTPGMVQFWITILFLANTEDDEYHGIPVPRGSFIASRQMLSRLTGMSEQQVRTCINRLIATSEITSKSTNKFSVITICNYESYQDRKRSKQPANQPALQPAINQQLTSKSTLPSSLSPTPPITKPSHELEERNTLTCVKKDIADSVESFFEAHTFSENFMSTWAVLTAQPKWKGKTQNALVLSLKKLARYKEPFAIMLMEEAIENNWQGVVYPPRPGIQGTEERYQQWLGEQAKAEDRQRATEGIRRAAEIQRQQQELEKRKARQEVEAARAAGFKPQWGPNAQKKATTPQEDDAAHRMKIQEQIRQIQTGQFNF